MFKKVTSLLLTLMMVACFSGFSAALADDGMAASLNATDGVFNFTPTEMADKLESEMVDPFVVYRVDLEDRYEVVVTDSTSGEVVCSLLFASNDTGEWITDPDLADVAILAIYCNGSRYMFDIGNNGLEQTLKSAVNLCNPAITGLSAPLMWKQLMVSYNDEPVNGTSAGLQYVLNYVDTANAFLFAIIPVP